jgi:uncharacterized membrane protein
MGRHGAAQAGEADAGHRNGGHGHGHGSGRTVRSSPRLVAVLGAIVAVVVAATVAGLVALWPPPVTPAPGLGNPYAGVVFIEATVESTRRGTCDGTSADRRPDGRIPATVSCVTAAVRVDDDAQVGAGQSLRIAVPSAVERAGLGSGDRIRLARYDATDGEPAVYAWADVSRGRPLAVLALVFAVLVVAVARLKGLAALAGLAVAYAAIGQFVIPALLAGRDPVLVAVVASSAIMTVLLYLAHGVTVKTTTALLGTLAGLGATAAFAWWATDATALTGLDVEEGVRLSQLTTGAGIGGVILCGIIIAGLGVLNDVTISQASAVWELRDAAPGLGARRLFTSGMRIGRDHLASVVYTIAFVYAGAALPTLMLQELYGRPLGDMVVSGAVAEELVRTLVTSSTLVLTIPLTTAVAAVLAASSGSSRAVPAGAEPAAGAGPVRPPAAVTAAAAAALPATAAAPPARPAVVEPPRPRLSDAAGPGEWTPAEVSGTSERVAFPGWDDPATQRPPHRYDQW